MMPDRVGAGSPRASVSTGHGPHALVVQHEQLTPGGRILEWLGEHDAHTELFRIDEDPRDPEPREYDLIVSLGSEFAAYDDAIGWLEREKRLLAGAAEHDVPVLGVCFGGQLLARVLGGDAFRASAPEIGWRPLRTTRPDLVPEGPWFEWHFDTFTPPPGAELIAESDSGPQAYVIGRSLGIQFHPEVNPDVMEDWVRVYRHEFDGHGVDADALLEETYRRARETYAASWHLFDGFLERVAHLR